VSIYGGQGIEWCPDCGAYRRVTFKTAKRGGGATTQEDWHIPSQAFEHLTHSDLATTSAR